MPFHPYPRLFISAARKSSGKTLLTLGLAGAFKQMGLSLRMYKKGPDYIDPLWHKMASGEVAYNLDPYLMGGQASREIFLERSRQHDLSLVEGNMGLHDGMDLHGEDSSAALARLLSAPVILVVDSTGMNRNLAAIVFGLTQFDPRVNVGGVVLNKVKSPRQEQKQRQAIQHYCGIPVLGSIPVLPDPLIVERHLGLITPGEEATPEHTLANMRKIITEHVDLARVREIASQAPALEVPPVAAPTIEATIAATEHSQNKPSTTVKIGVAHDKAFCFYYPENLEALQKEGAELVYFDTLKDKALPQMDGLYIGGGFPESFLEALQSNVELRRDIAARIEGGLPTYAECGGMMYLTRSIIRNGQCCSMVGVIPADVRFQEKPVGYGYVELSPSGASSWLKLDRPIRGHEFHYSRLVDAGEDLPYYYSVTRGAGMGGGQDSHDASGGQGGRDEGEHQGNRDGIVINNLLASYAHIHTRSVPEWSRDFVACIRQHKA